MISNQKIRIRLKAYDNRIREGIARALAVRDSAPYWEHVKKLFAEESDKSPNGVKWALGCILAAIAKKSQVQEVAALVRDRSHGSHRLILVKALGKLGGPVALGALEDVRDDPDVYKEVEVAVRKLTKRSAKK